MTNIKQGFLRLCKSIGLFHISRFLMRRRLLILCFHGFQLDDEARFRPKLFMRDSVLKQRLEAVRRYGFPVLPLGSTLEQLRKDKHPDNSVTITIDDGFFSVLEKAVPLLQQQGMPATLYVTGYHIEKETPIFRLVVQYLFWKTDAETLDLTDREWGPRAPVDLVDAGNRERTLWEVIEFGEGKCSEQERQAICELLGRRLGVDYGDLVKSRCMGLLTGKELAYLHSQGFDIQLHTHRHRLPVDNESEARREIMENREFLERVLGNRGKHLCYPSGTWSATQWPWLEDEGVESATTCEPGLNTADTPLLGLYRILDQDDLSQIEFEAELFGFSELIRIVTGKRRRMDRARRKRI